jgi:hypothetical protein
MFIEDFFKVIAVGIAENDIIVMLYPAYLPLEGGNPAS